MLLIFEIHILLLISTHCLGYLFFKYITKSLTPSFTYVSMTGLMLIALLGQIISIFYPTNFQDTLFSIPILLIICITDKNYREEIKSIFANIRNASPLLLTAGTILYLLFLLLSAGPVIMDDSESYHIQAVKWIQEYGSVPGLANLHLRYGFHSSWFNIIAFFSPGGNQNFFSSSNSFIGILLTIHLIIFFQKKKTENNTSLALASILLILLLLLFWPFLRANMQNSNYDYIFTVCTVFLFMAAVNNEEKRILPILFIWPVFLCSVRILYFPTLILTVYAAHHLFTQKKLKQLALLVILSLLLIVPFFVRNMILSGYPVYPSKFGKIIYFDWDVSVSQIDSLLNYIKNYNRINNRSLSIEEIQKIPFPNWILLWAKHLFYYDKILVIASLPGMFYAITHLRERSLTVYQKIIGLFLFVQIIVWFIVAPDPRFIYGVFFCLSFLSFVIIFSTLVNYINKKHVAKLISYIFSLVIFFSISFSGWKIATDNMYRNFVAPVDLPVPNTTIFRVDGKTFLIPHKFGSNWNCRCYALPLPCVYDSLPGVNLRGKELEDGFYIKELKKRHVP